MNTSNKEVYDKNKYFAFISYKREDEEWAIWLQHELEYYHLPASLNGRDDLPKEFRPVFRDIDELKAGNLPQQIYDALASSLNLIVICSPRSANSKWVNKEIHDFIEIGKTKGINNLDRIFPFIVDGAPLAKEKTQECFPKILRDLPEKKERIGGNINEGGEKNRIGRERAFVKLLAGMLPKDIGFDMLWNRYDRDKKEEENRKLEERNKLLTAQSHYLAEKSLSVLESGDSYIARLLALAALNEPTDRPYVLEAEIALRQSCQSNSTLLKGHTDTVCCITFSQNGKYIISASEDHTIRIWDICTGKLHGIPLKGHKQRVNTITCINDDLILSGSDDKTIRIWDINKCACIKCINCESKSNHNNEKKSCTTSGLLDDLKTIFDSEQFMKLIKGRTEQVNAIAYNDSYIISGHNDGIIRFWNINSTKLAFIVKAHAERINHICTNPNNNCIIASASDDNMVYIWNVKGEKATKISVIKHSDDVNHILFHPKGDYLVSASGNTIQSWETYTGQPIGDRITGHSEIVTSISFSQDGKMLLSASKDYTIRIWDLITGTCIRCIDSNSFSFFSKAEPQKGFNQYKNDCLAVFSHLTNCIASSFGDNAIHLIDSNLGFFNESNKNKRERFISFSHNGQYFITSYGNIYGCAQSPMEHVVKLTGKTSKTKLFDYSPNGIYITTVDTDDDRIKIWDAKTGKYLFSLIGHGEIINSLAFNKNGDCIASTSMDNTIRVWNIKEGTSITFHDDDVLLAVFNPKFNEIATIDLYNNICIWDLNLQKCAVVISKHKQKVNSLVYGNNGKNFITTSDDCQVRFWQISNNNTKVVLFSGHKKRVIAGAFSKDDKYIITASEDNTIRIWDVKSRNCIYILTDGGINDSNRVFFDATGTKIILVNNDGGCKTWDFPPLQDLIDQTRERFKDRPLTAEERRMYYLE